MIFILCLLIGILSAFTGSLVGLGGGLVLVPSLLFLHSVSPEFAWATPQAIVGISLIIMIFTSLSSTLSYFKKGRVDYKTGVLFLFGSIPGSMIGSWLNQFVKVDGFLLYFGILTICISLLFFIKRTPPEILADAKNVRTFQVDGETYRYRINRWFGFLLALFVGILSGLFGIGGGAFMVPAMILILGFPVHIAVATSMFMIFFVSIAGSITHIALGHIEWEYVFFFIPGAWFGGKLGAKINQLLKGNTVEWILRLVLVFIGLRMIWNGLA